MEDHCPVESGTCGTVQFVDDAGTLNCKFDDGRTLGVIPDVDKFHKIDQKQTQNNEHTEANYENEELSEGRSRNALRSDIYCPTRNFM